MIYLDSAAMYPALPCAREAFANAPFGNPSSEHAAGQAARDALEEARKKIADILDCDADELYFTATATEAACWAIKSLEDDGAHVIPSSVEHHAVSENCDIMGRSYVAYARMLGQNETGELLTNPSMWNGGYWLCDATAAVGHVPVSFRQLGCDYLLADGIKFGGASGAAILIAKKDAPLSPLIRGGGQERGMRSGTENVPAICAMAAALEWQTEHYTENYLHLTYLRDLLYNTLSEIPDILWNTPLDTPVLPHIINLSFIGVDAHALTLLLSKQGIMVSAGAACSNGLNEPSHVIMAMFNDEARARSAIRISLSHENTEEECVAAVKAMKDAVAYLRSIS